MFSGLPKKMAPVLLENKLAERRPFLAASECHPKAVVERVFDISISDVLIYIIYVISSPTFLPKQGSAKPVVKM